MGAGGGGYFTEEVSKAPQISIFRGPKRKGVNVTLPTMILKKTTIPLLKNETKQNKVPKRLAFIHSKFSMLKNKIQLSTCEDLISCQVIPESGNIPSSTKRVLQRVINEGESFHRKTSVWQGS